MDSEQTLKQLLRRTLHWVARIARAVMVMLVAIMLVALALQVVMRYAVGHALSWSEELALLCFSWSTLLAIALGVRDGMHVRLDLLLNHLPRPLEQGLNKLAAACVAGVGGFLVWAGQNYMVDSFGATSAAIGYPTAWLYACAPVGGGLICLFALEHLCLGRPVADAPAPAEST